MKEGKQAKIYFEKDASLGPIQELKIAVIGYGNQGRAQALNLRDSGLNVIIGNRNDEYSKKAGEDGFFTFSISEAAQTADIIFLLTPDETMPDLFSKEIVPNLDTGNLVNFASGYNLAFGHISVPENVDATIIAPRMIGVGVRERYLTGEGFFSFITVHQDASGQARERLLALAKAVGTLKRAAVEVSAKQEAVLDLFNEQAFGPAFGRVLLTSIDVLLKNGFPPEAVLTEMYLSEEMSYTYQKMAQIGLVQQTNFHSQTSQYGAMSRGARYLGMGLAKRMQRSLDEIQSGSFAREWSKPFAKIKLKLLRFFAMNQKINRVEKQVRDTFGLPNYELAKESVDVEELLKKPEIKNELDDIKTGFEF